MYINSLLFILLLCMCYQSCDSFIGKYSGYKRTDHQEILSNSFEEKAILVLSIQKRKSKVSHLHLSNSFILGGLGSPIQEDLPNLFGINPVEGAIIFGVLYYIYGPGTLYEYAREAGKFFSTYVPIIKEVGMDIYYEFRDYLEEERQRENLRKSGVDIDAIPRKTTNIIERFQESLKAFGEVTSNAEDSKVLKSAFRSDESYSKISPAVSEDIISIDDNKNEISDNTSNEENFVTSLQPNEINQEDMQYIPNNNRKRKTKKEVLSDRNVNIDEVKVATNYILTGTNSAVVDDEIKESVNMINTRLNNAIKQQSSSVEGDELVSMSDSFYTFPELGNEIPAIAAVNKFQQQMSGEWNQRVMRKDKYQTPNTFEDDDRLLFPNDNDDLPNVDMKYNEDLDNIDMKFNGSNENNTEVYDKDNQQKIIDSNNIPSDISVFDQLESMPIMADLDVEFPTSLMNSSEQSTTEGLAVLKELDKDYMILRKRFLKYLENQQNELENFKKNISNPEFIDN